jgi:hypothetical protein
MRLDLHVGHGVDGECDIEADVPPFDYEFLRRNKPMAVFGVKL